MDGLRTWLRAQLDADERLFAGSGDVGWLTFRAADGSMDHTEVAVRSGHPDDNIWIVKGEERKGWASVEIVHIEAERLADVRAKRRILDAEQDRVVTEGGLPERMRGHVETEVIKMLALPYAARSGYLEEWRP